MMSLNKKRLNDNYLNFNEKIQHWVPLISSIDSNTVKFTSDDGQDQLNEPRHKKKLVRVLTVVAYIISVSMAAILLSLYYVMFWNPKYKNFANSDDLSRICHGKSFSQKLYRSTKKKLVTLFKLRRAMTSYNSSDLHKLIQNRLTTINPLS